MCLMSRATLPHLPHNYNDKGALETECVIISSAPAQQLGLLGLMDKLADRPDSDMQIIGSYKLFSLSRISLCIC